MEALYDRFESPLYGFAVRLLGSREDGADVLQEMWCRAHLHQKDWITGTSIKSWLFGILRNLCFDLLRRRRHEPLLEVSNGEQDSEVQREAILAEWYSTWNSTALDPSFRKAVDDGLQQLAPIYRVLVLYAFDDWSYSEMAEQEGISESQVKGRIHRARAQLKEYLASRGYEPAEQPTHPQQKRERHG